MGQAMVATVLFLSANPSDTSHLGLDDEHAAIADEKARAKLRDAFHLEAVPAARVEAFRRSFEEHRPAVVHFGGHGARAAGAWARPGEGSARDVAPDDEEGAGAGGGVGAGRGEILVKGEGGRAAAIPIEALAEQLRIDCARARDPLPARCVVLNACHTAAQAEAIAKHVDCAIGTKDAIADEAAIAFARGFYFKLFSGASVQEAFEQGQNEIRSKRLGDPDVLVLRCREGVKAEDIRLAEDTGGKAPFHVPFPQNPHFVGRDEDLARLHRMLEERGTAGVRSAITRAAMLVGMGGIGKTQLAVEYAYRNAARYSGGVYWINAAGKDWRPEIARLAVTLGLGAGDAPEAERQIRLIATLAEHLRRRPDALVVLDNVDDPADLDTDAKAGFVPSTLGCRVLFTTRRRDPRGRFGSVELSVLPKEAALELLLSGEARRELWEHVCVGAAPEVRKEALGICEALGRLPLAVTLAAAYLGERPEITLADYQKRLSEEGGLSVVDAAGLTPADLPTRHEAAVEATLQTQWAALQSADAEAVLRVAALLGEAEQIPRARLALLSGLRDAAEKGHPAPLGEALRALHRFSLVEELTEDAIRLHPLVREFAFRKIPEGERGAFGEACAGHLAEAIWDLERLHDEVAKRGVDTVLEDLRTAAALFGPVDRVHSKKGRRGPGMVSRVRRWLGAVLGTRAGAEDMSEMAKDAGARFAFLRRLLEIEAHHLRPWDPAREPGFMLQQLRKESEPSRLPASPPPCEFSPLPPLSSRVTLYAGPPRRHPSSMSDDATSRLSAGGAQPRVRRRSEPCTEDPAFAGP